MRTTYVMVFVLWCVCSVGCEERVKPDYSRHFQDSKQADPFYKGTVVVRETLGSLLQNQSGEDRSQRKYEIVATDIADKVWVAYDTSGPGDTLTYPELKMLMSQGFNVTHEKRLK